NSGTDYAFRAVVDLIGLGALPSNVAIYPFAQTDRLGAPLTGTKRYVVHFNAPGGALPHLPVPANDFWSLSLTDSTGFFRSEPDRPLRAERSLRPALQRGRLARPLHPGRRPLGSRAGQELAARASDRGVPPAVASLRRAHRRHSRRPGRQR